MKDSLLTCVRRGAPFRGFEIIDMHGHLGRYSFTIPDLTVKQMIAHMDRVGVARIVVSHHQCMNVEAAWGNREVLKAMRAYPGRILGYASFWPASPEAVRRETEKCLAAGFTGLKLHNSNGFSYDDPAYQPAYALANERCLPVLYHTWGGEKEFREIRAVSEKYPDLALLLAHAGCQNEARYLEMARECPNVYLELAFSKCPLGLIERIVAAVGAERIVWGSDLHFLDLFSQVGRVAGARLSAAVQQQIMSGNARRILGRIKSG